MLSIRGIYENGEIKVLERMPKKGKFEVIITFIENQQNTLVEKHNLAGLLSDLNNDDFEDIMGVPHKGVRIGLTKESL
jgi:hypothetical protein